MKRRRNAPISKRDKKALKRILRSHKGRGNSCRNPSTYRSDLVPRSKSGRAAYKRRLKQMSPSARRAMILALANPKRGRGGKKSRRRGARYTVTGYGWEGAGARWHIARHWAKKWRSGVSRVNPRRSRKWRKDSNAEPVAKRYRRKSSAHGKRWGHYGNTSTARSRRWAMANPKRYSRQKRKPKRKYGTSKKRYAAKALAAGHRGVRVWSGGRTRRDRHHRRTQHRWAGKAMHRNPKRRKYGSAEARYRAKHKRASRHMDRLHRFDMHGKNRRRNKWRTAAYRALRQTSKVFKAQQRSRNPKRAKGRKTRRHGKAYTIAAKRGKQFFQVTGSWKSARRHARPFSKKRGWKSERRSHALVWNTREDRSVFDRRGRWRKPPF